MDLQLWLNTTQAGEFVFTALVSMLPVVELRGGIPFGVALGLQPWQAMLVSILGNLVPVPFIILFVRKVFEWMRKKSKRLERLVSRLEARAEGKWKKVQN